jgi:hypothetical protein
VAPRASGSGQRTAGGDGPGETLRKRAPGLSS